ncbi:MAG TPA: ABC transporter ATP-binding protein [Propylenella sp.]|nr:ABC transporter ATP-binding protein [Propylenella sp.]
MAEAAPARTGLRARIRQQRPIPLDVALEVEPGEILALVGPSGSGKTTTLRVIAGLTDATEGAIVCNGRIWFDGAAGLVVPARRRRVGLVFQSYALFPHLTAIENVIEALTDRPASARRAEAQTYLARVHLDGLEERRPKELSGGQQQRVAVARALARRPDALLLDEPFSAVDRMTRFRLQRELAGLRDHLSMPVILVTHDLEEAARLADRIAVIHRGEILQTGKVSEVMTRPATPQVARLVGIRNVFDGTVLVERIGGKLSILWRGYRLETTVAGGFAPGERISWCIPADNVIVHRRDRPSRGEHENPVQGQVGSLVRLGETTELVVEVGGSADQPLHCSIPTHVAGRNGLAAGIAIGLSLKADAIQLMQAEPDTP